MKDAVVMVAQLGGFLDRRCDGNPGNQTFWNGMRLLGGLSRFFNMIIENPTLLFCQKTRYGE